MDAVQNVRTRMDALQDGVNTSSTHTSYHYDGQNTEGGIQHGGYADNSHCCSEY
jgi:hypothetical protein